MSSHRQGRAGRCLLKGAGRRRAVVEKGWVTAPWTGGDMERQEFPSPGDAARNRLRGTSQEPDEMHRNLDHF